MRKIARKKIDYYLKLPYTIEILPYEDGGFFAKIKELPGCMTEGDSLEEVIELIEDAKKVWLEAALEEGKEIPLPEVLKDEKEYSGKVLLRLPKYLHKELTEEAEKEGVSLNSYIVTLLAERHVEYKFNKVLFGTKERETLWEGPDIKSGKIEIKIQLEESRGSMSGWKNVQYSGFLSTTNLKAA